MARNFPHLKFIWQFPPVDGNERAMDRMYNSGSVYLRQFIMSLKPYQVDGIEVSVETLCQFQLNIHAFDMLRQMQDMSTVASMFEVWVSFAADDRYTAITRISVDMLRPRLTRFIVRSFGFYRYEIESCPHGDIKHLLVGHDGQYCDLVQYVDHICEQMMVSTNAVVIEMSTGGLLMHRDPRVNMEQLCVRLEFQPLTKIKYGSNGFTDPAIYRAVDSLSTRVRKMRYAASKGGVLIGDLGNDLSQNHFDSMLTYAKRFVLGNE